MDACRFVRRIAYEIDGEFAGKKPGKRAKDLSGAAAMPARGDGGRVCLFINDESRHAQFAVLSGRTITPGALIDLIGDKPIEGVFGTPPQADCPKGEGDFAEFDGEGVAYQAPYFYVAGSHGCGRETGEFLLSAFMLARIRVDAGGVPADRQGAPLPQARWSEAVELTYRLSEVLRQAEPVGAFFGKGLGEEANGLNIEGLAVDGGRLLSGLRAPSLGGRAFIVGADLQSLFAPGHQPVAARPEVIPLPLGPMMGIRDLAMLPDGRLLVLAGPAQKQDYLPYRFYVTEPRAGAALLRVAELETVRDEKGDIAKAEAVMPLDVRYGLLHALVLYDGIKDGGPVELILPLP
jgi:hypothetical protein